MSQARRTRHFARNKRESGGRSVFFSPPLASQFALVSWFARNAVFTLSGIKRLLCRLAIIVLENIYVMNIFYSMFIHKVKAILQTFCSIWIYDTYFCRKYLRRALDTRQPGTVFKKLDTRQSEILTNFLEIARLIPLWKQDICLEISSDCKYCLGLKVEATVELGHRVKSQWFLCF